MSWVTNMIITTLYYLLSGVTFFKLLTASGEAALDIQSLVLNRVWRAPLAATFLGALLVFGFNMFSCCILIKKSINRSGPGFGYGFLVAFCFTLAFFCLLVGLIMDSFKNTVEDNLTGYTEMTNPYVPMADPAALGLTAAGAGGAVGLGATVGAGTSDGKGMEGDAQYTTQYNPNDYMTSDQYNQYYSNQYNQASDAYQTTTEFNPTSEYAYDQEQGYQAPYDAAGYSAMPAGGAAGATTPPYAAAPPPAYDNAATASAAFYGQQGAYAAPAYSTAASAREPIL